MTTSDDDEPKKPTRATLIRRGLVLALALACAGGWIYTRYLVKKETLGGPCSYDIHCRSEAPRCMKEDVDGAGVCTRQCDTDSDCADGIKCIKVQLDDYDDRGKPLEGGYCFPQALLDARRRKKNDGGVVGSTDDAGTATGSWIKIPESPDQFEGTITYEHNGSDSTFEVKGSIFRVMSAKKRVVVDASTFHEYAVDDDKKEFGASVLGTSTNLVTITKTDKKDTVAGHECQIWQLQEVKSVREACVMLGGSLVGISGRGVQAWEKELAVRSAIPLRLIDEGKTRLLATKVDPHPIDDKEFLVPKSYHNKADIHL